MREPPLYSHLMATRNESNTDHCQLVGTSIFNFAIVPWLAAVKTAVDTIDCLFRIDTSLRSSSSTPHVKFD